MKKTTSQLLAKLKEMATQAGESLFERAAMAIEVLADAEWIVASFNGDVAKAEENVAADCFPDLSMTGWFGRLVILRKTYGDIEHWRKHKFNLQRLWIEHEGALPPKPAVERWHPPSKKEWEDAQEDRESTKYQLRKERAEKADWQERCRDLERELAECKGRIAELERMIDRRAIAVA